jgi:hypothetical protein
MQYVEAWILEESPRFRTAYEAYYQASVKKNAIPLFATTHMERWRAAERYPETGPFFLTLFGPGRAWYRQKYGQAVADGDVE